MKNNDYIIEVKDLEFAYVDGTKALDGINLNIKRGEKLAIMGANGSGKSTFFLTLNGIRKPKKGQILFEGKPIEYTKNGLLDIRKKVGIVFQDPDNQLFAASVKQEISFGPYNLGLSDDEVISKVDEVMDELNINSFSHKPTHFLSGGQKKRVAVADVLVMDPQVMILDEPAAGLDPKHIGIIDDLIEEMGQKGITVIVSTHDVARTFEWADRVVLFNNGKIIGNGSPIEIFRQDDLLKATNLKKPPVLEMYDNLVKNGIVSGDCDTPRCMMTLEEVVSKHKIV